MTKQKERYNHLKVKPAICIDPTNPSTAPKVNKKIIEGKFKFLMKQNYPIFF